LSEVLRVMFKFEYERKAKGKRGNMTFERPNPIRKDSQKYKKGAKEHENIKIQ